MIDHELAERLENRRLDIPRVVIDRGIHYETYYDIGGGKRFSQSLTSASKRVFGWSRGALGLRCSYAQERMSELQGALKLYNEALEIVSQEMGRDSAHFDPFNQRGRARIRRKRLERASKPRQPGVPRSR
jgi:hypothetical protein